MNNESALKTFSREIQEITKWVNRKSICVLGLQSNSKEIICPKTTIWGRKLKF